MQSLRRVDDGHALELLEHEQIVVPRDDQIGARCECQREHHIIIRSRQTGSDSCTTSMTCAAAMWSSSTSRACLSIKASRFVAEGRISTSANASSSAPLL